MVVKKDTRISILFIFIILFSFNNCEFVYAGRPENIPVPNEKTQLHPKIEFRLSSVIASGQASILSLQPEQGNIDNRIRVVLELSSQDPKNLDIIIETGVTVERSNGNLAQILIEPDKLYALAENDFINYIRYPHIAYPSIVSQGVDVVDADLLHDISIDGSGVKVAILDLGFEGYSDLVGTELPNGMITRSFSEGGLEVNGDHGTACAEIVHDVAPEAELYLVSMSTGVDFLDAMDWLISQDVDVISFSVGFVNTGPGDGTDILCQKVDEAVSNGLLFVASSGNYAGGHYEGLFNDPDADNWHDFGEYESIELTAQAGDTIVLHLSWAAPWPTNQDYDLVLYDYNFDYVDSSENIQDSYYPVESIYYSVVSSGNYYVCIYDYSTTSSYSLELFSTNHDFNDYQVPSSSIVSPAYGSGAFAVGATDWSDDSIHSYSSQGPTNDGRTKPDVVAPSGVSNSVYGSFYGTSASCPHVAGVAALLLQDKSLTVNQLKQALEASAVDLGSVGKDNVYGAGRVDAFNSRLYHNIEPTTIVTSPNNGGWFTDSVRLEADSYDADGTSRQVEIEHNLYTNDLSDDRWVSDGVYIITSDLWYHDWSSGGITSSTFYFRTRTFDGLEWGEWDTNDSPMGVDNTEPEAPTLIEDITGSSWSTHNTPQYSWDTPVDVGSGIQYYEVKIDESTISQVGNTHNPTLEDGIHTCQVRAVDNVGNIGGWSNTVTVQIDTTAPSGSIVIQSDDLYTITQTVTLSLQSSDSGGSGVIDYALCTDGVTWGDWQTYAESPSVSLNPSDGLKTLYVKYRDQTLLESETYSDTITLDETSPGTPILTTPLVSTIITDTTPLFSWSPVSDSTSGLANYYLEIDVLSTFDSPSLLQVTQSETSFTPVTELGYSTWYWRVYADDNAGNEGTYSDTWSFSIATPYAITVEAYCESCLEMKIVTFSLNSIDYQTSGTLSGLQLSNDLSAPRMDGSPLHGFKEWTKDGASYSNEHDITISESGTYRIVFEEKTPGLDLYVQEQSYALVLNYNVNIWSSQTYTGAIVSVTFSDGEIDHYTTEITTDLVIGESIVSIPFDTIQNLDTSYIGGSALTTDISVKESDESLIFQDSTTVTILTTTRAKAWTRVVETVSNWGMYSSFDRPIVWNDIVVFVVSNWGIFPSI